MPVHNGELFLKQSIESILNQTYQNFEFIIIDNCSSDSSMQIINSFQDRRIKIIKEPVLHQVAAYNKGFKESRGDIIFIADQDDINDPERINIQLEFVLRTNSDICGSYFNIIDKTGKLIGRQSLPTHNIAIKNDLLFKNYVVFNSSVCLKKEVFNTIGYFRKEYYPSADYEFYLRASPHFKFCNVPKYLYSWRVHSSQISASRKKTQNSTMRISILYLDKMFKRKEEENYFFKKGLIFYYNDHLLKSLLNFIKEIYYGHINKKIIRYVILISLLGIPLKIYRKSNLIYSYHFNVFKKLFEGLFS